MKPLIKCERFHRSLNYCRSRQLASIALAELNQERQEQDQVWLSWGTTHIETLQSQVQTCAQQRFLAEGKACHAKVVRLGLQFDTLISNMLINMYSKCGVLDCSRRVFDEMPRRCTVSFNTMIGSYTQNGNVEEGFSIFRRMQREGNNQFSEFTVSSVLCACAAKSAVLVSTQLHAFSVKTCLGSNMYVGTALVDVYAKCNSIQDAFCVFEDMPEKNDVTWSSMVTGFVHNELYEEALVLFYRACTSGLEHDRYVISAVIAACAALAASIEGTQVHSIVWKTGFGANVFVASALVDMYSKCGSVREAYFVFMNAEEKNIVLWNSMISGFARHARPLEAMIFFEKMHQMGFCPNEATYVSMLSACSHKALVAKARIYFDMIRREHGLEPNVYHYSCMVDVLSRAGLIHEAKDLIDKMPFDATASMWGSLLASCRVQGNVELAEVAARNLFKIEPHNAGNHVLLSNTYAANRRWNDVALTRKHLKESEAKKERGKSWVEVKGKVHMFMAGEISHPRMDEIYSRLDDLLDDMRKILGYKGEIEHDLHDVEVRGKEQLLRHHSEKLAFTFGLMCLPSGAPIRIMKNLRICGDCHSFMKAASSVTGREIIVRDNSRFHHFKNGHCTCGEFW